MLVGRLLSFWDAIFLGAMLNFQGVIQKLFQTENSFTSRSNVTVLAKLSQIFKMRMMRSSFHLTKVRGAGARDTVSRVEAFQKGTLSGTVVK